MWALPLLGIRFKGVRRFAVNHPADNVLRWIIDALVDLEHRYDISSFSKEDSCPLLCLVIIQRSI